ncbi:MAG: hypothetical protein HS111_17940 [Kofleriaceae bacterium]|nr:hypothetical protein [Kofleriaceae bacterium]
MSGEVHRKPRKQGLEHFIEVRPRPAGAATPRAVPAARGPRLPRPGGGAARGLPHGLPPRPPHQAHLPRRRPPRAELPRKSNYLLAGPTGSGKTYLVESLFGKLLRIPTALVDITTYSETGYVGQDPSTILTRCCCAADDNPCWPRSA